MSQVKCTQCFLFFVHERRYGNAATSASRSIRFYALLPEVFKTQHPEVLQLFLENNVVIISGVDGLSLQFAERDKSEVVEVLLVNSQAGNNLLFIVEEINVQIIQRLVFVNSFINVSSHNVTTKVPPAINGQNASVMKYILSEVNNICYKHPSGESLLHLAARRGHTTLAQVVLESGMDVNTKCSDGSTPLFVAASTGHLAIVEILIKNGANVESKTNGSTALHVAVEKDNADIVKFLLLNGANIEGRNDSRLTVLHVSAMSGHHHIVTILLQNGADIEGKTEDGMTALHLAAINRDKDVVLVVLHNGADVNSRNYDGKTPLFSALEANHLCIVQLLLSFGASLNVKLTNGRFAIEDFATEKNYKVFQILLDSCFCDPEIQNETGAFGAFHKVQPFNRSRYIYASHLLKISSTQLYPIKLPTWMSNVVGDVFRAMCEFEVMRMKRQTIGNSNVTFFDVLTKNVPQVARYLRNRNVEQIANSTELLATFPKYGIILLCQFKKGRWRKWAVEEGVETIDNVSVLFCKLPLEIKERILDYLSLRDIFILKHARAHTNV